MEKPGRKYPKQAAKVAASRRILRGMFLFHTVLRASSLRTCEQVSSSGVSLHRLIFGVINIYSGKQRNILRKWINERPENNFRYISISSSRNLPKLEANKLTRFASEP